MINDRSFGAAQLTGGPRNSWPRVTLFGSCPSALQPEGDRTVVDQRHLHVRAEHSAGHPTDASQARATVPQHNQTAPRPVPARRRRLKPGRLPLPVSAASVNCGTSSRPPEASRRLRFMRPPHRRTRGSRAPAAAAARAPGGVVASHHADQCQQARADFADQAAVDPHAGLRSRVESMRSCSGKTVFQPVHFAPVLGPFCAPLSSTCSRSRYACCRVAVPLVVVFAEACVLGARVAAPALAAGDAARRQRAVVHLPGLPRDRRTTRTSIRPTACRSWMASTPTTWSRRSRSIAAASARTPRCISRPHRCRIRTSRTSRRISPATELKPTTARSARRRPRWRSCASPATANDGVGIMGDYPTLAGQHADYLARALEEYKHGDRKNAVMPSFMTASAKPRSRRSPTTIRSRRRRCVPSRAA